MPATPLVATSRYIPPGVRQYYFVAAIANKNTPLRAELDAGTDLTSEVANISGFTVTSNTVDAPDLGTRFTSQVAGRTTADKSSIDFYASDSSDDVRTLLPRDTKGFIVIFPEGDHPAVVGPPAVAATKMDVFPVTVSSASIQPDMEKPGTIEVQFTITSQPVQNLSVPT